MEQNDYEELACQLRCPEGEKGEQVAEIMFESNSKMIFKTIDRLQIEDCDNILELGFGSGKHFPYLFQKAKNIHYCGLEISPLMIDVATRLNQDLIQRENISLKLSGNSSTLQLKNNSFKHCFSVNTVYFWEEPHKYLQEIYRILQTGGSLALSYIKEDFVLKQPFAKPEVFHFHRTDWLIRIMKNIGYSSVEQWQYIENTPNKLGENVVRPFIVLKGFK